MPAECANYWIGPSGWSYPDWDGCFYERGVQAGDRLAFIARYFNAVEVNTTFYRPVSAAMTASWVRKVDSRPDFRFAFKLTQSFTHDRGALDRSEIEAFRQSVAPVVDAERFGCLLVQFPWSFRRTAANVDWVRRLCDAFQPLPMAVEVRHASWDDPVWRGELAGRGVAVCRIDQPALRDCLGATAAAPATPGGHSYFRFHGRRADTWFADGVPVFERYNYLYSREELSPWVERIRSAGESSQDVYVFTNNHYRGQAPANALELRAMLDGAPVEMPATLVDAFPRLAELRAAPAQRETLFE